jgi:RNA polymerase sigma-70 factor, ECF subfamily
MSEGSTEFIEFTKYRGYLQFLAKTNLSLQYGGKFDRSDIVQKTLLNAFTARQQFQGKTEAELIAWLKTILIHQIAQATREVTTQKRDIKREQSIEAALDASSMRLGNFLAAHQSSPSQQAVRQENIRVIADALEGLPENQRQVLILRFWEGMTIQQVADSLGKSTPAIAGLLHRATKKLRGVLAEIDSQ